MTAAIFIAMAFPVSVTLLTTLEHVNVAAHLASLLQSLGITGTS